MGRGDQPLGCLECTDLERLEAFPKRNAKPGGLAMRCQASTSETVRSKLRHILVDDATLLTVSDGSESRRGAAGVHLTATLPNPFTLGSRNVLEGERAVTRGNAPAGEGCNPGAGNPGQSGDLSWKTHRWAGRVPVSRQLSEEAIVSVLNPTPWSI